MATADDHLSYEQAAAAIQLLREAPYAYLAMTETEGPYVLPLNFAYEGAGGPAPGGAGPAAAQAPAGDPAPGATPLDGTIYFHTGEGRKTAALAADPRVCLAVTGGAAFVQGDSPCRDAFSYRSLLVWGRARLIEGAAAREAALRVIVAKYDPAAAGMPFGEKDFAQTLLFAVTIERASFKQEP
jgi:nitroimidazol reductase NimA-like FMN-containing flavoprotein (pyridoxamine 5'-phosphate oxidase superfamily)